jgi:hypothetical protein
MSIWHNLQTILGVWCGHLSIEQRKYDQSATLRVRRVKPESTPEHVQLEVTINKHGEKRTTTQSFCFQLTPEQVDQLIVGLTKLHPPYDPNKGYQDVVSRDAEDRKFYGLT